MRKIKLIWDFRGQAARKTAEHHEIHLKEFIQAEKLQLNIKFFCLELENCWNYPNLKFIPTLGVP